jgi:hypothetical protein
LTVDGENRNCDAKERCDVDLLIEKNKQTRTSNHRKQEKMQFLQALLSKAPEKLNSAFFMGDCF